MRLSACRFIIQATSVAVASQNTIKNTNYNGEELSSDSPGSDMKYLAMNQWPIETRSSTVHTPSLPSPDSVSSAENVTSNFNETTLLASYPFQVEDIGIRPFTMHPSNYFPSMNRFSDLGNSYDRSFSSASPNGMVNSDNLRSLSTTLLPMNLSVKPEASLASSQVCNPRLYRAIETQYSVKEARKKPLKTIKQLLPEEIEMLEWSYKNNVEYTSPQNCNNLAKRFGLNRLQIKRWFLNRKQRDLEGNEQVAHKEPLQKRSTLSTISLLPTKACKNSYISKSNAARQVVRANTATYPLPFPCQIGMVQKWRANRNLWPPPNELYLSNLSNNIVFRIGEKDANLLSL